MSWWLLLLFVFWSAIINVTSFTSVFLLWPKNIKCLSTFLLEVVLGNQYHCNSYVFIYFDYIIDKIFIILFEYLAWLCLWGMNRLWQSRHKDTKLHKNEKKDEQQCGSDFRLGGQGSLNSLNLKTPGIYFGAKKGLWIHLFSLNSLNFLEFSLSSFWVFHEKRICWDIRLQFTLFVFNVEYFDHTDNLSVVSLPVPTKAKILLV